MRKVSKSKAAMSKSPKRKSVKDTTYAEDESDADLTENDVASSSNGKAVNNGKPEEKKPAEEENLSEEEESFEVESILGFRVRHGTRQFKIRWRGFGPADDTWEDEENIDSPELVAAYLKKDEDAGAKTPKSEKKGKASKGAKKRGTPTSPKTTPKKPKIGNADDNAEWEVTKIIDDVELKDGTRQFLVRWRGYSSKDDTWEPEANLNCADLIKKYLELQEKREENSRETRDVRKQVYKYNPELTKRQSHRSLAKKRVYYHDLE